MTISVSAVHHNGVLHTQTARILQAIFLIGLLYATTSLGASVDRVMERVDARKTDGSGIVEIQFSLPVAVATQCQAAPSVLCDAELQLNVGASSTPSTTSTVDIHETISPSRRDAFPLLRIDYFQSDERRGRLTLSFDIPVVASITGTPDGRSVIVTYESPTVKQAPVVKPLKSSGYVRKITLKESQPPLNPNAEKTVLPAMRYDMYTSTKVVDTKTWHQLHLGFFTSEEDADKALQAAKADYPNARIEELTPAEVDRAQTWIGSRKNLSAQGQTTPLSRNARLMETARQALIAGDNPAAIRAYSGVVQSNDPDYLADALEYLGVARERNNQLAHAKAEYEDFLRRYPEGEAAARVRQRLEGLITARTAPKGALKDSGKTKPQNRWEFYGSLTQFYRGQKVETSSVPDPLVDSSLDSTLNITARQKEDSYNLRTEFSGTHRKTLTGADDDSSSRLYTLSAEAAQKQGDYSLKAGRQSINTGGIYGRFDGAHYLHRISGQSRVGITAGYPVDYSLSETLNKDRRFIGTHITTLSKDKAWNNNVYIVEQRNQGMTDRRAVGANTQYFRDGNSLYAIVDYDVYFNAINQATLTTTRQLPNKSTIGLTADYRKSPLLTINNAIIGQTVTLAELKTLYSESELKRLAMDRTADYSSFSLSYSQPYGEKYQFSADLSASTFGGTPASGGVDAISSQGTDYYFSTQMVANNFFDLNDITLAGLRFSDSDTGNSTTLSLSSRLPVAPGWRLYPKLSIDWRDNSNGSSRQSTRSSLSIDYRAWKSLLLQIEVNYDQSDTSNGSLSDEQSIYYLYAGYIYDF